MSRAGGCDVGECRTAYPTGAGAGANGATLPARDTAALRHPGMAGHDPAARRGRGQIRLFVLQVLTPRLTAGRLMAAQYRDALPFSGCRFCSSDLVVKRAFGCNGS